MWRKNYLLGIGYLSATTECSVLCNCMGFSSLWASWCFLVRKGQVQSYKGKHCSLVGIQYTNIGAFKSFGTHNIQSSKKIL